MKKTGFIALLLACSATLTAQEKVVVKKYDDGSPSIEVWFSPGGEKTK